MSMKNDLIKKMVAELKEGDAIHPNGIIELPLEKVYHANLPKETTLEHLLVLEDHDKVQIKKATKRIRKSAKKISK